LRWLLHGIRHVAYTSKASLDVVVACGSVGGAGTATANASEKLDATVDGAGSVEYVGDPMVEQDVSGAGRISKD